MPFSRFYLSNFPKTKCLNELLSELKTILLSQKEILEKLLWQNEVNILLCVSQTKDLEKLLWQNEVNTLQCEHKIVRLERLIELNKRDTQEI